MAGMAKKTGGFIGAEALGARVKTDKRTMVTIVLEDTAAVPIGHEPVYLGDTIIGQTTSAAYGYRVGAPIALAHVSEIAEDAAIAVDLAGVRVPARMQLGPAFDPTGQRMRP